MNAPAPTLQPVAMQPTVRLTMAQALVRWMAAQFVTLPDGSEAPLFGGVFAIFGHGNVAGVGEALHAQRDDPHLPLPTLRAHNEQAMAHSAIAYAKAHFRRRMMAVTTSIGPGATNLVTAAALAHVNRLPVLLLPGDTFVSRAPDPVLQQIEVPHDATVTANDALRAVSRYFDRIVHPAQLLGTLPRALRVLTDAALCGPVTLALPQDVQAAAYDYPASFFARRLVIFHAPAPSAAELQRAAELVRGAHRPLLIAGGGVLYGHATDALAAFVRRHRIPVAETQAGKGALNWDEPLNCGAIGVTGSPAANQMATQADVVIAVGSRLQDFTTGSHSLFPHARVLAINASAFDTVKCDAFALCSDAAPALDALSAQLRDWQTEAAWHHDALQAADRWRSIVSNLTAQHAVTGTDAARLPYDADLIGAVQRSHADSPAHDIVVCAAGTLPAELHKLWRAGARGGYHVEYGFSCMGYEIAGGLGVKLARPEREVIVMVGDGSYLMMNSEIATSVMLGAKLIIVVLDNRGYGCINRLQQAVGGAPFNNMLADCLQGPHGAPATDFAAHARALGALAEHVDNVAAFEAAMQRARAAPRTYLISIDTDAARTTAEGGWWWEVAVPQTSARAQVHAAYEAYLAGKQQQRR
ncbi:3D-(3,5/4)-trihydroxycyclohexane-1,2-dione acylhydrolase (decyclizing) [Paraburkholderia saeva]|uniref:3D-(3,5/4)-trihydroxycyclohexane-1,2-dione hydrolase n=1 Tax=Paraburkholderia saeva TaxID=2777537 RepID=A0A9N8X2I1_9BURK|nr:3D-(3,5/4)-trihydroxycyclohexane-1,2-dione acylhydrolase (decyclizing) [Paraburkholderia saeva]CAG4895086.1 3D-(3,5/4)-trihydroxycyclohexane-1,2-dione hydrolase [Paraburkholderia saeva]